MYPNQNQFNTSFKYLTSEQKMDWFETCSKELRRTKERSTIEVPINLRASQNYTASMFQKHYTNERFVAEWKFKQWADPNLKVSVYSNTNGNCKSTFGWLFFNISDQCPNNYVITMDARNAKKVILSLKLIKDANSAPILLNSRELVRSTKSVAQLYLTFEFMVVGNPAIIGKNYLTVVDYSFKEDDVVEGDTELV